MKPVTVIWMLKSDSSHRTFQQSTQYHIVISSKAWRKRGGTWTWSSVRKPLLQTGITAEGRMKTDGLQFSDDIQCYKHFSSLNLTLLQSNWHSSIDLTKLTFFGEADVLQWCWWIWRSPLKLLKLTFVRKTDETDVLQWNWRSPVKLMKLTFFNKTDGTEVLQWNWWN